MPFKSIVVATDGSDHAHKAVALAGDLAGKYDARLTVVDVITGEMPEELRHMAEVELQGEIPPEPVPDLPNIPGTLMATFSAGRTATDVRIANAVAERIAEGAAADAREHGATKVTTVVEAGDPVREILAVAKRENADLIVLGSRGLGDLKGLLLGSVSHKVTQLAACTCITVK